jgi:hypothetical protein
MNNIVIIADIYKNSLGKISYNFINKLSKSISYKSIISCNLLVHKKITNSFIFYNI